MARFVTIFRKKGLQDITRGSRQCGKSQWNFCVGFVTIPDHNSVQNETGNQLNKYPHYSNTYHCKTHAKAFKLKRSSTNPWILRFGTLVDRVSSNSVLLNEQTR